MPGKWGTEEQANQYQPQQEGAQVTRSAKSQANQAKAVAAAATKLERFVRTTLLPVKSQQPVQARTSVARKSQGSGQASVSASPAVALSTKTVSTKEQGVGKPNTITVVTAAINPSQGE